MSYSTGSSRLQATCGMLCLGIDELAYRNLCNRIDSIYHCGAEHEPS